MNSNSPDYLTYKKSKIQQGKAKARASRLRVSLWIFVITFLVMFAIVVQVVRKYSTRIDIEYGRNQSDVIQETDNLIISQGFGEEAKRAIDKRLKLIQLEENAPNEAKILSQEKEKDEVIDLEEFAKIRQGNPEKKEGEIETQVDSRNVAKSPVSEIQVIYSKVLIGKYATLNEARTAQTQLRAQNTGATPFIRKVGDIYALQVGSYRDIDIARSIASKYRDENYDVWILQQ